MSKISTIEELRLEKQKLALYRYELEEELHINWNNLKESLNPAVIAGDMFKNVLNYKAVKNLAGNGLFKNLLILGFTILTKRLVSKAGEKLNTVLKR